MIPITFVPQIDIGDIAASIALVIAIVTFYISYDRISRSEQIKTSRDLWQRINEKYAPIIDIGRSKGWPKDGSGIVNVPWPMVSSFLILVDEIKDEKVLHYYKPRLSDYIKIIMRHYASPNYRYDLRDQYYYFDGLIKKWNIDLPEEKT